jgi:hypothetical protein
MASRGWRYRATDMNPAPTAATLVDQLVNMQLTKVRLDRVARPSA